MVIPSLFRSLKWSIVIDTDQYDRYQPYHPGLHKFLKKIIKSTKTIAERKGLVAKDKVNQ